MAQIKNIKKPGDLIRGAKVGVAGLDKDGNVVGTGIDAKDLATWPEGAQSGDVLVWGGETGPEWAPPSGGTKLYKHDILYGGVMFSIINSSDTPFKYDNDVQNYLRNNGYTSPETALPAMGSAFSGTLGNVNCIVYGVFLNPSTSTYLSGLAAPVNSASTSTSQTVLITTAFPFVDNVRELK